MVLTASKVIHLQGTVCVCVCVGTCELEVTDLSHGFGGPNSCLKGTRKNPKEERRPGPVLNMKEIECPAEAPALRGRPWITLSLHI